MTEPKSASALHLAKRTLPWTAVASLLALAVSSFLLIYEGVKATKFDLLAIGIALLVLVLLAWLGGRETPESQ